MTRLKGKIVLEIVVGSGSAKELWVVNKYHGLVERSRFLLSQT